MRRSFAVACRSRAASVLPTPVGAMTFQSPQPTRVASSWSGRGVCFPRIARWLCSADSHPWYTPTVSSMRARARARHAVIHPAGSSRVSFPAARNSCWAATHSVPEAMRSASTVRPESKIVAVGESSAGSSAWVMPMLSSKQEIRSSARASQPVSSMSSKR